MPEGELPTEAARSLEPDVLPLDDPHGAKADRIEGALGEFSPFDEQFGIYADGVADETSVLPTGWRDRLIPYVNTNPNGVTGWCLERHDLCVAKLAADRSKDREFVGSLLRAGIVDPESILRGVEESAIEVSRREGIATFVRAHGRHDDGA